MLVRPDIEGVKNVEHLLLALNPGFCLPEVQKGPGELASWIPGHTSANQDFHVPQIPVEHTQAKLDIFSTENQSKRCSCKDMLICSPPPTPQVFLYQINWGIFPIKILIYTTKKLIPKFLGNFLGKFFLAQKITNDEVILHRLLGCLGVYSLLGNYIFLRNLICCREL